MTGKRVALWMFASVGLFATAGAGLVARFEGRSVQPKLSTAEVTRRDVAVVVQATGTIEAVSTVQVGTQVSGTVQTLSADFNSLVTAGQVLARLDPSLFQAQVEQARANVVKAEAQIEQLNVAVVEARSTRDRTARLAEKHLVAPAEMEAAEVALKAAGAQVKSAEASLTQARAALRQAEVNLEQTVITSPINGIVITRNVDAGQTVAASMQAPTLFELAADLTKMRVNASVDESDVGRVQAGQAVRFTVDAYPDEAFTGTVAQVRLDAQVAQNVVTYTTVIDVDNPELKLKPGMTATVSIEVARTDQSLTVPAAALRVKPSEAVLAAYNAASSAVASVEGRAAGRQATVWRLRDGRLEPIAVQAGLSDGLTTAVSGATLAEGDVVVTAVSSTTTTAAASSSTRTSATATRSPLLGSMPGPPPMR